MASREIKVAQGGCILVGSELYKAGMIIPDGKLTEKQFHEHVRSGYGLPVNHGTAPEPEQERVEKIPGRPTPLPLRGSKREQEKPLVVTTATPAGVSQKATGPIQISSPWTMDPAALKGKTLDQLNVMVLERDSSVEAFASVEEAVAWLSQDFGK